jgi:predicted nucleic acid-binding protein
LITADTNIFAYVSDASAPDKQAIAAKVVVALASRRAPISLQLIGELQSVLRRKFKFDARQAADIAGDVLTTFRCFPTTQKCVGFALAQLAVGQISYWDALMLASAREAGCDVFISEDLQDGARLFGLEIVNPFAATGLSDRVKHLLDLS